MAHGQMETHTNMHTNILTLKSEIDFLMASMIWAKLALLHLKEFLEL